MRDTNDAQRTNDLDRLSINTIRTLSIDAVQQAKSGHPERVVAAARTLLGKA